MAVKRGKNKKIQFFFKRRLEKKQKKYYIMEHEEIRAADTDYWKPSWRNGRRAWFRSKFFHRSGGSTPPDGTIFYTVENFCGYGITAVHQPSKLDIRVRLPLPAPSANTRQKNHGWILERSKRADCKSASDAFGGSNPPPATILKSQRQQVFVVVFFTLNQYKKSPEVICPSGELKLHCKNNFIFLFFPTTVQEFLRQLPYRQYQMQLQRQPQMLPTIRQKRSQRSSCPA